MGLNDHPKLKVIFYELMEEKEKIVDATKDLRVEREKLRTKMQPLETRIRELNKAIQKIERPKLGEIDTQLAAIAKAAGGYTIG